MKCCLKNIYNASEVFRDGVFKYTSAPEFSLELGICYAVSLAGINKINKNSSITSVITTKGLAKNVEKSKGVVIAERPDVEYYKLHNELFLTGGMTLAQGQSIASSAHIEEGVILPDHLVVGERVVVEKGAIIEDYTVIGDDAYIGQAAVLGARGMQNLKVNGERQQVLFAGGVRIGSGCEVLSHAIIQKPYQCFYTEIGCGTQVSVKSSIGHGSFVGAECMIAGGVTVSGNVILGEKVWVGPGSVIADGLSIGDLAKVRIGSVVVKDVPAGAEVSGNFAIPHKVNVRNFTKAMLQNKK